MTVDELIARSAEQYHAGRPDEALALCQQVLAKEVNHVVAWSNAAAALATMGRWVDALAYARQALTLEPQRPDALNNCTHILVALGRSDEAALLYRNLGWSQYQAGDHVAATKSYERSLELNPNDIESLHVLAGLRSARKENTQALMLMNRGLAINPQHLTTLAAKGNLLGGQAGQELQAEACFKQALNIEPKHWMTLYNYGVYLAGQNRFDEAVQMYVRAGHADPTHHLSFWNLSNLLLRLGDYPRAWPMYEWRWKTDHLKPAYLQLPMPLWTGQDLKGKRILLHFEQGYGDAFQFIRFAKDVSNRGAHVTIFMPREICDNFVGVEGVHEIRPWNDIPQGFDYHAPLMSLPAPLGLTTQNIPSQVPYMFANPERIRLWQERLPKLNKRTKQKLRIGLAWCGRPTHDNDRNRSIAFAELVPLIEAFPNVQFVSMQVGPRESDLPALEACANIVRIEDQIQDFSDTAALTTLLDVLISVDTSVVHLAGALGKPVWALIAAASDWRWLLDEGPTAHATPWYPNVRLFRQSAEDGKTWNWTPTLARVQSELEKLLLSQ
jgi:tetratricopeptide (TPR) repeat protein